MAPWRVIAWAKALEAIVQLRPSALRRVLLNPDPHLGHAMRWYTEMGRRVWTFEVKNFLFRDERTEDGPTVAGFWGDPQDFEEEALVVPRKARTAS
jgi:anaerobic magnesium-protoporphyrin IX monomethyl ester cyclase